MAGALLLVAAVAVFAAAAAAVFRASRRDRAAKAGVLADSWGLLSGGSRVKTPAGYGALRGSFAGYPAALTPIAEALAFRRLPQLWISAALKRDGGAGAFEIIRRPTGAEFFSGGAGLPQAVAPLPSWPQDTSVRCDEAGRALLRELEAALVIPLADPRVKIVAVSPGGVRVVRQAAQGARGAYLLFRDTKFSKGGVPHEQSLAALSLAAEIARLMSGDEIDVRDAA